MMRWTHYKTKTAPITKGIAKLSSIRNLFANSSAIVPANIASKDVDKGRVKS